MSNRTLITLILIPTTVCCFFLGFRTPADDTTAAVYNSPESDSTLRSEKQLSETELFPVSPSGSQLLKYWILTNPQQFQARLYFNPDRRKKLSLQPFATIHSPYQYGQLNPAVDYRESSLYIPGNVQAWTDYKMGREPYLPLITPLTVGFMLYSIAHYARILYQDQESPGRKEFNVTLDEIRLMNILWQKFPLTLQEWYAAFSRGYPDSVADVKYFQKTARELENKSLIKTRVFVDQGLKYFPALDSAKVYFRIVP